MAFEPILFFFIIWLGLLGALTTTFLYILIRKVPSQKVRILIPIFYCILIYPLIKVLNPQPDNVLYPFSPIGLFIFTCMLILIPFPMFEKKLSSNLHRYIAVFFGGLITLVLMYGVYHNQSPGLLSSIGILSPLIIIAFTTLVFTGITVISKIFVKPSAYQTPELEQTSYNINKRKMMKIALLLLIICMIPIFLIYGKEWFFGSDSDTGIIIILVNKSEAQNGTIIHLTEKDFKEFPRLASVIRDNEENTAVKWPGGKNAYGVLIKDQERYRFIELYWSNYSGLENGRFFEYDEKYYSYNFPPIA
jgi:hypothetical protein